MRTLVIGGSGFIGLNLVDALLAAGHTVRVTRRKHTVTLLLRKRGVELVDASLEDAASLRRAMHDCDAVFLAAAYYPRYSFDRETAIATGVAGVSNACNAARDVGVRRFIYTSSIASLAQVPRGTVATEDDVPTTMPAESTYRAVKWAMERTVEKAIDRGLPAVTLLPGGCIGPWDLRVGTGALLVGCVRGELPWWVDGTVNVVDVGDVARAHVAALTAPLGRRYALGGQSLRVGWLLRHVVRRFGGSVPAQPLSAEEAQARADRDERTAAAANARVPFPRELVDVITSGQPVSSARARDELGITFTPLDDALERAHAWFVRFRYIPQPEPRRSHEHV